MGLLRRLGIIGWEELELPLLAGLVTGDPVLLLGTHGEGKSHAVRVIFKALGKKIKTYDASKAMFEDILGFPVPAAVINQQQILAALATQAVGQGITLSPVNFGQADMVYLKTPLSIDDDTEAIFIDELSRAKPQTQNKWLELIRSRTIMGLKTRVKWVFAAMNPQSYTGANTLDKALLGRFAFFLPVPETIDLEFEDAKAVALMDNGEDAVALKEVFGEELYYFSGLYDPKDAEEAAETLRRIVYEAQHRFFEIARQYTDVVADYVTVLAKTLATENIKIDGRRRSMLRRNIIAALAVEKTKNNHLPSAEELADFVWNILQVSLPYMADDENLDMVKLQVAHRAASDTLQHGDTYLFNLNTLTDPLEIAKALNEGKDRIPLDWQGRLVEKMLIPIEQPENEEDTIKALGVVIAIARPVAQGKISLTAENRLRILSAYKKIFGNTHRYFAIQDINDAQATQELQNLRQASENNPALRVLLAASGSVCFGNQYDSERASAWLNRFQKLKAVVLKTVEEVVKGHEPGLK